MYAEQSLIKISAEFVSSSCGPGSQADHVLIAIWRIMPKNKSIRPEHRHWRGEPLSLINWRGPR